MTAINFTNARLHECYALEIDGKIRSEHQTFVEALKAGFEIKQKFPHSQIKVHETNERI
jgi:hypothetical protein